MRFLLLEDYFPLQQEIVDLLEWRGHETLVANGSREATAILETTSVDAVIADIFVSRDGVLTSDGGFLLITRIRQKPNNLMVSSGVRILVITGATEISNGVSMQQVARDLGATDTLKKPVAPKDLIAWIDETEIIFRRANGEQVSGRPPRRDSHSS